MKIFELKTNFNLTLDSEDSLNILIDQLTTMFNILKCNGKIHLINIPTTHVNNKYEHNDILIKKYIIENIHLSKKSIEKKIYLEIDCINENNISNAILFCPDIIFIKLTNLEILQLKLYFEHRKSYDLNNLEREFTHLLNISKKKSADINSYISNKILENNQSSIIQFERKKIKFDSFEVNYLALTSLFNMKKKQYALKNLLNYESDLIICFTIGAKETLQKEIKNNLQAKKLTFDLKTRKNEIDLDNINDEIENIKETSKHFKTTLNAIYQIQMIIVNYSKLQTEKIESMLIKENIIFTKLHAIQENARNSTLFNKKYHDVYLPCQYVSSNQLAELVLMVPNTINEKNGVFLGHSKLGKEVFLNFMEYGNEFNNRTSKNFLCAGNMGQGKSFAIKKMITEAFIHPKFKHLYIIDPDGEYQDLVKALGGQVVNYSFKTAPNFLDLKRFDEVEAGIEYESNSIELLDLDKIIDDKIHNLNTIFKMILQDDFKSEFITNILTKVYLTYFKQGNDYYNYSYTETMNYILTSNILKFNNISKTIFLEIKIQLDSFFGGIGRMLDVSTPLFYSNIITFNIKEILTTTKDPKVKKIITYSLITYIQNQIFKAKENDEYGLWITDEFNKIVNDHDRFLEPVYKMWGTRIRKYNFSLGIIIHVLNDMNNLKDLFLNTQIKLLFYTGDEYEHQKDAYGLTKKQYQIIQQSKRGHALLISGTAKTDVQIIESGYEHKLFGKISGH